MVQVCRNTLLEAFKSFLGIARVLTTLFCSGFSMTPSMQAFLGQTGQIQGMQGHAILAQRLAVLPPG